MIAIEEAIDRIRNAIDTVNETERIDIEQALGRLANRSAFVFLATLPLIGGLAEYF